MWSSGNADQAYSSSESDGADVDNVARKQRTEADNLVEAANAEVRETAEEKRLRLARDVLWRLDAEQQEHVRHIAGYCC